MRDVVEMKKQRWSEKGVDYEAALSGNLQIIPNEERLKTIKKDHQEAINGLMFFNTPDNFDAIIEGKRRCYW